MLSLVTFDIVGGANLTKEAFLLGEERGPGLLTRPVVGVLILKMEDSRAQIYALASLSQLSCADWPLARLAVCKFCGAH